MCLFYTYLWLKKWHLETSIVEICQKLTELQKLVNIRVKKCRKGRCLMVKDFIDTVSTVSAGISILETGSPVIKDVVIDD